MRSGPAIAVALAAAIWGAGCDGTPDEGAGDGGLFVAFAADFAGFSSWEKHTIENGGALGLSHVAGPRTIFINRLPPPDATAFPVGTMIVKVTDADGKIFARAKRGGTFNATGAAGWEWFELIETAQHDVVIKWRGVGPPIGEVYGGDPNAGCNACHKAAVTNDSVLAPGLVLTGSAADGGVDAGAADADPESGDAAHE
jgi:hypothetical protein